MTQQRRANDKCLAKRLYEVATPYIQIIGWFGIALPLLFAAFSFFGTVQALEPRVVLLESYKDTASQKDAARDEKIAGIDKKIDLMMDFWRISNRRK